jgi:hypothetical protein
VSPRYFINGEKMRWQGISSRVGDYQKPGATLPKVGTPSSMASPDTLLGHSSLDTMMIYTEPSLDDLTQRMERIEMTDH